MIYIIIIPLIVLAFIFIPIALIWALNTLFALAIPFTVKTWAAALILGGIVSSSSVSKGR